MCADRSGAGRLPFAAGEVNTTLSRYVLRHAHPSLKPVCAEGPDGKALPEQRVEHTPIWTFAAAPHLPSRINTPAMSASPAINTPGIGMATSPARPLTI